MGAGGTTHTEHEDHPWTIQIPDHPKRADSATYVVSRGLMKALLTESAGVVHDFFLGGGTGYQDHHGGGLWVKDDKGWMLLKNLAGMEWSQQFCADPKKVDHLRQIAERIYAAFPLSIPAMKVLLAGHAAKYDIAAMLSEPIVDQAGVSRWVDSIFNASMPIYAGRHTGVLAPKGSAPAGKGPLIEGGVHHYPTPITDIQLFKYDDFQLWVVDAQGQVAAVTPAGARGSGNPEVNVAFATPGTDLHKAWMETHLKGEHLTLSGDSSLATQAFADQPG